MKKVCDLMIPIDDYAVVSETASLKDAVIALQTAADNMEKSGKSGYRHRAVVVLNKDGKIIGKISLLDVLKALEPGYDEIGDFKHMSKYGFSGSFIRSMIRNQGLWEQPLDNICIRADSIKVKDAMYTPVDGEYVDENATLNEGIHQLIMGHHQSLLVTRGKDKKLVGVLRLTDVFLEVCNIIHGCSS